MDTSRLQFNIIYTPDTVRYLTPFVTTLLKWSDCRYRLISNGCSETEVKLLQRVTDLDERLELLVMPEARMIPHGEMLDFLYAREESEYFCFMDSDIVATAAFLEEFRADIENSACFSSCLPLWHDEGDITIPSWFRHMHGIHAYTEKGEIIACDYFVIFDKQKLGAAMQKSGVNMQVVGWQDLSAHAQEVLQRMEQKKADYDTGKVLTMLMLDNGDTVRYRQSDALKHIGGFTEVGAKKGALLYTRGTVDNIAAATPGNFLIHCADIWYAWRAGARGNSWGENRILASRVRRRTATARYFYLLLVGLMDDKPVPAVPRLGDHRAEQQIRIVSDEIRGLMAEVRLQPGPWQDS
jgi:hypothetical protein